MFGAQYGGYNRAKAGEGMTVSSETVCLHLGLTDYKYMSHTYSFAPFWLLYFKEAFWALCMNENIIDFFNWLHLLSGSQHHDRLPIASGNVTETQDADFVNGFAWNSRQSCYVHSHGCSSLLCYLRWTKVMVWHFVSNAYEVMTALIVMLPSNSCCRKFSAVSWIYCLEGYTGSWSTIM